MRPRRRSLAARLRHASQHYSASALRHSGRASSRHVPTQLCRKSRIRVLATRALPLPTLPVHGYGMQVASNRWSFHDTAEFGVARPIAGIGKGCSLLDWHSGLDRKEKRQPPDRGGCRTRNKILVTITRYIRRSCNCALSGTRGFVDLTVTNGANFETLGFRIRKNWQVSGTYGFCPRVAGNRCQYKATIGANCSEQPLRSPQ